MNDTNIRDSNPNYINIATMDIIIAIQRKIGNNR